MNVYNIIAYACIGFMLSLVIVFYVFYGTTYYITPKEYCVNGVLYHKIENSYVPAYDKDGKVLMCGVKT